MFLKCIMSGSAVLSAQMYCYRGIVLNDWSCIRQCHKIFTIVLSTSVTKITILYNVYYRIPITVSLSARALSMLFVCIALEVTYPLFHLSS